MKARKTLGRRDLLKQLGLALAVAPALKLSETVARAERRRRNHRGAARDAIWIGHC